MKVFVILFLLVLLVSCKTAQTPGKYSICIEDGVSRLEVPEEFASCFGISVSEIDGYEVFSKTEVMMDSSGENLARERLKNDVSSMIAEIILYKLKSAFGQDVEEYWQLERITIPVSFRSFRRNRGNGIDVTVVAIVSKSKMTARALIKYLPLEYQMRFIDKKEDKYYFKDDPMSDF